MFSEGASACAIHVDVPSISMASPNVDNSTMKCSVCLQLECQCKKEGDSVVVVVAPAAEARPAKKQRKSAPKKPKAKQPRKAKKASAADIYVQNAYVVAPPPVPAANVIREKVLEGDEVVAYYSPASDIAQQVIRMPVCTACGSFEEQCELMGCVNCAHYYHRFCIGLKTKPVGWKDSWRCPACKECEVCHNPGYEDMLLVCEKCDRGFHTFCLPEPLGFIPIGDWLCHDHALCVSCGSHSAGFMPQHCWHDNDTLCHQCWVRIRNKAQCPSCMKAYDASDWSKDMVGCECERWVHVGCDGLTPELYQELQKPERADEPYACVVCRAEKNIPQFRSEQLLAIVEEAKRSASVAKEEQLANPIVVEGDVVDSADVIPEDCSVTCGFCGSGPSAQLGRLVPVSRSTNLWIHTGCALWSKDVTFRKTGGVLGIVEAVEHARNVRCVTCGGFGASLCCRARSCASRYHLPCALKEGLTKTVFMCSVHTDPKVKALDAIEVGSRRAFVTLPCELKIRQGSSVGSSVEQTWQDRLNAFISKNPGTFLNKQYEETVQNSQTRDAAFIPLADAVAKDTCMQRGSLLVVSFGTVNSFINAFHSTRYIFPVGFRALRRFWSYRNPLKCVLYECTIHDVEGAPKFIVTAEDDAENAVSANDPSKAWEEVMQRFPADAARRGDSCWREEMFGFTAWVVSAMEGLMGASACAQYNFQFHARTSGVALGGQVNHPMGCARLIPYQKNARKEGGTFVYSRVTAAPKSAKELKSEKEGDSRETPDFIRYRHMEQHPPQLVVHKSRIHGMGVYTLTPIKKGDFVIEYQGEIIREVVADKREREYEKRGIPCYLWKLDEKEKRIVDATFCGNMARFINHCHDPNCVVDIVTVSGVNKVMVSAKRDIIAGEELTYDYMFDIPEDKIVCECGAINCPGFMNLPPTQVVSRSNGHL